MQLPRFLLLRMWKTSLILLITGINFATVHCQAGYQVRPPFQTQHVSYPAPRIPLGYQPPPTGALVDQYNNPYDMTHPQPPPPWQSRQPQPLTMIHMPHNQNIQPPVIPQTQFQHQQPVEYFEQPHTAQAITSKPPEPLLINTLIQVFSRGDSSGSSQQPSTFSLAEAHMITAVKDRSHPESQTIVDGVLSAENRVVISRQLDTQTRTFVVPSSGGQPSSSRISPENLVAVKAFAATNSTKISASELESELNKELETSIPAIIDELEKVNKSREKATGATPPQAIPLPAGGQQTDEVNIKDLEELVSTALAEVEQGGWTVTTPSTSSSTTVHPTTATTSMPLIVFTKTSRIFPPTESTPLPSSTTTEWVHSGEKIPEAEGSHEEDKLEDGQRWAPSTPPTGLARTIIVNIPEQEEESEPTASATQPAAKNTEPSALESTMSVNIPEVESTPQPVPAGTPSTEWTHPNEQGSTFEGVATASTRPVNIPPREMTSEQTEAQTLITTETSIISSSTVTTMTVQVSAEGIGETTIPTFITTTLTETQSPELVTTATETNLQTTVVEEQTSIIGEAQTSTAGGSAIPEGETEVTTGKSTLTFVETTETIQSIPESTISTTVAAVIEETTAKIAESEDESVPEITATEEEKPQQEVCPNDSASSAVATLGDNVKGDVLFLLDSSSSVGRDQFRKSVKLIHDTVQQFRNIGPNGIQISLIQYNREPYVEFTFRRHNCLPNALADIADTVFMNGVSNLGRAIEKVMKYAFTKPRGDRPDAENVLVLITDGQSDDEWQIPLELTKVNGTTMLVIATVEANKTDLMMLAADDPRQNFFNLTELTLNTPLSQRLASRVEQILQRSSGTQQPKMIGFGNEVAPEIGEHVDQLPSTVTSATAPVIETGSTSFFGEETSTTAVSTSTHASLSDPAIECLSHGIKATFQLSSTFTGSIVANDFFDDPKCVTDVPLTSTDASSGGASRPVSISIQSPNCGLHFTKSDSPKGLNQSLVLNIIHDKRLQTSVDRSFVIQCFIPLTPAIAHDHKEAGGEDLETDLKILPGVALSKTISLERMPPRCNYSLRRDSPNGAVMQSAAVGQILFHRWECDGGEDSIDVFGILIHDCRASNISSVSTNSAQPYQIIDRNGCSADPSLLGEVVYAEDRLLAFAKAFVFTIKDVDSLRFSCKVSMCLRNGDGCEGYSPPMCNSTNISELLLSNTQHGERMHDSSLETALTGELDSPKLVVMPSPAALAGTNPRHLTQRARRLTTPYLVTMVLIAAVVLGSLLGVVCFVVSRRCWPTRKRSPSSLLERANDSDVCSANEAESNSSQRSPAETRYQPDLLVDWAGRRITRLGTPPTALRHDRVSDAGTRNSDNDEDWKSVASTVEGAGDTATSEHQRLATLRHQPDAL